MDLFTALKISSSGLSSQRLRMNVISSNLANINTTRTPQGGPYRRQEVIFAATPIAESFGDLLEKNLYKVKADSIIEDPREPKQVYDPNHPDADNMGYVQMPNINLAEEMVNMVYATHSYEANIAAIQAAKNMMLKALEI